MRSKIVRVKLAGMSRVVGVAVVLTIAATASCKRDDPCDCSDPPAVTITAPRGAIAGVKLSGDACASALPTCPESSDPVWVPGCAKTLVFPRLSGVCDVEIDLDDGGIVRASVLLLDHPGPCCRAPQPTDAAAGAIVVDPGDAGVDAP